MFEMNVISTSSLIILLMIVIADLAAPRNNVHTQNDNALVAMTQYLLDLTQRIMGKAILSLRFFGIAFIIAGSILLICVLFSEVFSHKILNSKARLFFPSAIVASVLCIALTPLILKPLSNGPGYFKAFVILCLWLVVPVLLWLSVMHFGTWLEWRDNNSPLAYGSEWFYADVYDKFVRNPAGLALSLCISVVIFLPVVAPAIWIVVNALRFIFNLKRGAISVSAILLFATLLFAVKS